MKWFQHSTDSHDDPDISDAWDAFGDAAVVVFWTTLELYAREYNHIDEAGWLTLSKGFLRRKLRKSWTKVERILNFYEKRKRILLSPDTDTVKIKVPKMLEIASDWTKRHARETEPDLRSGSGATPAIRRRNRSKAYKEKENSKKKKKGARAEPNFPESSFELRASKHLFKLIKQHNPNHKEPNFQTWAKSFDLMRRRDKRPEKEIAALMAFVTQHEFWSGVILSPANLRKNYDRLLIDMRKDHGTASSGAETEAYRKFKETQDAGGKAEGKTPDSKRNPPE